MVCVARALAPLFGPSVPPGRPPSALALALNGALRSALPLASRGRVAGWLVPPGSRGPIKGLSAVRYSYLSPSLLLPAGRVSLPHGSRLSFGPALGRPSLSSPASPCASQPARHIRLAAPPFFVFLRLPRLCRGEPCGLGRSFRLWSCLPYLRKSPSLAARGVLCIFHASALRCPSLGRERRPSLAAACVYLTTPWAPTPSRAPSAFSVNFIPTVFTPPFSLVFPVDNLLVICPSPVHTLTPTLFVRT